MILAPLKQLNELTIRIDYLFDLILLTFEPSPGVRTIAYLWPGPPGVDFYIYSQNAAEAIKARFSTTNYRPMSPRHSRKTEAQTERPIDLNDSTENQPSTTKT